MTLPEMIAQFTVAKPGWLWSQTQRDGMTVCHLHAPELEGRTFPRHDMIGQFHVGTGASVELAFYDALRQALRGRIADF
ncbi:MAG: hypothetical protein KGL39_05090 [Patescibacteria group bacterium]|nr:hypothetical protein [Patescibacteria group bacterium]